MNTATLSAAAPYIIQQDYSAYTDEQHAVWAELVGRVLPELEKHAARAYLDGFEIIGLQEDCLPDSLRSARALSPEQAGTRPRSADFCRRQPFLRCWRARRFPTTTWLRGRESLEYTPEPDIFHDVFGHVPMHAHRVFADFLEHYGRVCASIEDAAVLEKLGRLFWYTVEFGVIREGTRSRSTAAASSVRTANAGM